MDPRELAGQRGSIPLTLIVAIILGGVVIALFTIVQSGSRSSAVDRDAAQSVQVADAGVQDALVQLRGVQPDEVPPCTPADGGNTALEGRCIGDVGLHTAYEWRYVQTGPFAYEVASVGAYRTHEAAVSVETVRPVRFLFAITTKSKFTYNGAGGGIDPPIAVGTYANATVNGTPAINSIECIGQMYQPDEDEPAPDSYSIDPDSLRCDSAQEGPDLTEDIAADACFDGATRRATNAGQDFYSDSDDFGGGTTDLPTTLFRGYTYCVRGSALEDSDYTVEEHPDGLSAYEDSESPPPANVYIVGETPGSPAGGVTVGSAGKGKKSDVGVNWGPEPDAGKLFLAIAEGAGDFTIYGNAKMAGGIWAPWSTCTYNGTPDFRGAVVCDAVTLNGNFGYDDDVNNSSVGEVVNRFWSQERVPAWGRDLVLAD